LSAGHSSDEYSNAPKQQNSLGKVLVEGSEVDISNINCYLQLLAQNATKKEKLRRKKRREHKERKKKTRTKDRKKSRREEGKEKEVESDRSQPGPELLHQESKISRPDLVRSYHPPLKVNRDHPSGLFVAPTLPSSSKEMAMRGLSVPQRHMRSNDNRSRQSQSNFKPAPHFAPNAHYSHSLMVEPSHPQFSPSETVPPRLYHRGPVALQSVAHTHHSYNAPPMSEHQSCSNSSFNFSSDSLSPVAEEGLMGSYHYQPSLGQPAGPFFNPPSSPGLPSLPLLGEELNFPQYFYSESRAADDDPLAGLLASMVPPSFRGDIDALDFNLTQDMPGA